MFRPLLIFLACSPAWAGQSFLEKGDLAAVVTDSIAATRINGYFAAPVAPKGGPFTDEISFNKARTETFLAQNPPPAQATLSIEWLNQNPEPRDFHGDGDGKGVAASSLRMGATHISRTVVATEDAIILHFIADKPGDLSFRTRLIPPGRKGEVSVHDRRELVWKAPGENAPLARVWIIPFESDVENEGDAITLRGEGECLVIFNFTREDNPLKPLADTWRRLIDAHDPGAEPADPTKIWAAVREKAGLP